MFVCLTTYRGALAADDPILPAHWAHVDRELAAGRLVASGPQDPRVGGVMLLRIDAVAEANALMRRDPLVVHGRIDYVLVRFTPTRAAFPELLERG